MFTAITVRGFKSIFDEQTIRLAPITVFAGANSGGKSSASQPLLLMKQTLESQFDPGAMLLYGPNVKFTSVDQVLSRGVGAPTRREFSVGFHHVDGWQFRVRYDLVSGGAFRSRVDVKTELGAEFSYTEKTEAVFEQWSSVIPQAGYVSAMLNYYRRQPETSIVWAGTSNRCFPDLHLVARPNRGGDQQRMHIDTVGYAGKVRQLAKALIHIRGLRGNPERSYLAIARTKGGFPGVFEDYVASILMQWQADQSRHLPELGSDLRTLGLTWKVKATPIEGTHAEIKVGRLGAPTQGGAHDLVSLADVGLGVSQVLPFLVALRAARKGQIVFVEQPEIHLHPRAQFRLAEIIVQAVARGVVVWLETHSSILIRGLQTQIALGNLQPKSIALHWFDRDSVTGGTTVSSCVPDEFGRVAGWPADFDDVSMYADRTFLDAVTRAKHSRYG